jgi:NAD(P)-dependent dehydrogenase (short-subunit alcohol dehydrogenase family)
MRPVMATGARVILACRDVDKADEVRRDVVSSDSDGNAVIMKLDLSSMKSIKQFADEFNRSKCTCVYIYINGARGRDHTRCCV